MRAKSIFTWFIIVAIIVVILRRVLGIMSINTFLFLDNLFYANSLPPWVMWALPGLIIGAVAGAIVALKKYKLAFSSVLIPLLIFIVFTAFMYAVNQPAEHESTRLERKTLNGNRYVTVTAESTLPDSKKINNSPANLLDYNENTAWTGALDSNPKIDFTFTSLGNMANARCIAFRMMNGYNKTRKQFNDYNRVKSFFIYSNDNLAGTYYAGDVYNQWQDILIKPISIKNGDVISLHIDATYTGDKHADQIAITELFPVIEYFDK